MSRGEVERPGSGAGGWAGLAAGHGDSQEAFGKQNRNENQYLSDLMWLPARLSLINNLSQHPICARPGARWRGLGMTHPVPLLLRSSQFKKGGGPVN